MGLGEDAPITRRQGLWLLAGGALWLVGCGNDGGGPESTPDTTPLPTTEPTPTVPPSAALGPVTWSTALSASGEPNAIVDVFPRDEAVIYAAVEATNLDAGETLTATWSINGTPIKGVDTTVTIEEATTAGWVTFSLTWEGEALWPVGQLGIAISASSGQTTTGAIQIVSNQ